MDDEIKEENLPAENAQDIQAEESTAELEGTAENTQEAQAPKKNGKILFYIAIACTSLGAIFYGLTFSPLAVYSLLASILFCLASLSLLGTQKKRKNFKGVLALTIVTYILLGIFLAFFIGGVIWSSLG